MLFYDFDWIICCAPNKPIFLKHVYVHWKNVCYDKTDLTEHRMEINSVILEANHT